MPSTSARKLAQGSETKARERPWAHQVCVARTTRLVPARIRVLGTWRRGWHGSCVLFAMMLLDHNVKSLATNAVFEARALTKTYRMGDIDVVALQGVDLDLFEHEFVVLLGPSGSGKSTLLNILGGLDVPTSGAVHFRDHDLTACDDAALTRYRRDHVGFVFQFYNLIPSLTAWENVAIVTDIARRALPAEEALALVGLEARMDHYPSQMSGGEQQRVAIARAIAKRPDVLLCDEPTGALDSKTGILVLEAIDRVNREMGTTTVVITHNSVIADLADRVVSLSGGRIANIRRNARRAAPADLAW